MTIPMLAVMVLYICWMIYSWMFRLITWRKAKGFVKLLKHFRAVEASHQCSFADNKVKEPLFSLVPMSFFDETEMFFR